jgi:hypothetical protein
MYYYPAIQQALRRTVWMERALLIPEVAIAMALQMPDRPLLQLLLSWILPASQ